MKVHGESDTQRPRQRIEARWPSPCASKTAEEVVAKFKPRLPIASGGSIDFEISASDWRRIETEYGRSLAPSIRIEVLEATQKFLDAAEFEKTAPYASEAIARIKSIRTAAREFRAKIMRRGLRQDLSRCGLQETTAKPPRTAERGRTFGDAARRARAAKALCRREGRPRRSHPRAIGSAV